MVNKKLFELINNEFDLICKEQNVEVDSLTTNNCKDKLPFLERLAKTINSSVAVLDVSKSSYCFFQSKYKKYLGYDYKEALKMGPAFFIAMMHPEEIFYVLNVFKKTAQFLKSLPIEDRMNYKLALNCRIKEKSGKYVQMILQLSVLELDKNGNIWLVLILDNLLSENMMFQKVSHRLINLKTLDLVYFKENSVVKIKKVLSTREIEILHLCSIGLISKEIAEKLSLSINTINNHKQKIFKKLNASNITEAIYFCEILGLL